MKRFLLTFALLAASSLASATVTVLGAAAEDETLGQRTDRATGAAASAAEEARKRAAEAAKSATTRVGHAAKSAKEQLGAAAHETKEKTRGAAQSLSARARDAALAARQLAVDVASGVRDRAIDVSDSVGDVIADGKDAAASALETARGEARDVLLGMAEALDGASRQARKTLRRERWQQLKERFSLGNKPSAAVSDELLDHEYRVARLERARELAQEADDERAVAKSDRLLEAEYARHKRQLEQLHRDERKQAKR